MTDDTHTPTDGSDTPICGDLTDSSRAASGGGIPRVVSLAPSATTTLTALNSTDCLVGVTHHCDPPAAAGAAHDEAPTTLGGWLNPDLDRLAALEPDLVCTSDDLQADLAVACRARGMRVNHHEPATLPDVLKSIQSLAGAVDKPTAGETLVTALRARLDRVADAVSDRPRPTVYCEEWSDPPMAAGNWVPDAVRAAGGRYPFVKSGERSREIDAAVVESADPDHAILHVCGHGSRVDPGVISDRDWDIDPAVHVIDDSLLNQPSPALIDGVERLASILHPNAFDTASSYTTS